MADAADHAKNLEQLQRQHAIDKQLNQPAEKPNELHGHRYCLECDIEINTKRLVNVPNAVRCVDCQTLVEQQNKHYVG